MTRINKLLVQSCLDELSETARIPCPRWKPGKVKISYFDHGSRIIIYSRRALEEFAAFDDLDQGELSIELKATISLVSHEWKHWKQNIDRFCQHGQQCKYVRESDAVQYVDDMILTDKPLLILRRYWNNADSAQASKHAHCFRNAAQRLKRDKRGILVHGKVNSIATGEMKRIDHAWVEYPNTGMVWEPHNRVLIEIDHFYNMTEAEPYASYDFEQFSNVMKHGHWGPWP